MRHKLILPTIKQNYLRELLRHRGVEDVNLFIDPLPTVLQEPEALENMEEGRVLLLENLQYIR